jgi:uncharacterized iron-regulated membrane protein
VMRKLHRWISLVAALFLAYVAVTGVMLVADQSAVLLSHLVRPVMPVTPLRDEQLSQMLAATYRAAQARFPGQRILSVELRMYGDTPEGIVWTDQATPYAHVFDTDTGQELTPDSLKLSKFLMPWHMHQVVKRMHRGDIIGLSGRWMGLLVGLALLTLCATSLQMYWQLYSRRWRSGRRSPFWS